MDYTKNAQFRDFGIILARIDDRLVHGQVVAGWNRILKAKNIAVIDDDVAGDDFRRSMIEDVAAPGDIEVSVFPVNDAGEAIRDGRFKEGGAILLFVAPSVVVEFLRVDDLLDSINVGGLHQAPGKREYATALWLDDNDIEQLRTLRDMGKELFYQMVPMENARDLFTVIERE